MKAVKTIEIKVIHYILSPWTLSTVLSEITTCWTLILTRRVTPYKGEGVGGRKAVGGRDGKPGTEGRREVIEKGMEE